MIASDKSKFWPKPKYGDGNQPHFIFILTPPNSGSTAIKELLNSSSRSMVLTPRGEGQWLIPGLCADRRWKEDKYVDFESVKSVWLNKYESVNKLVSTIDFVIEKSPPNMMRFEQLSECFDKYSIFINNRNPYACIASSLYRHYDIENFTENRRIKALISLSNSWVERSLRLKCLSEKYDIENMSYEDFCDDPKKLLSMKCLPGALMETVNFSANVKVKDYDTQPVSNQNERQIGKLLVSDIECISRVLSNELEVLDFFGYALI